MWLSPPLDSKFPALLAVNQELARGQVSVEFHRLVDLLVGQLGEQLRALDACIVHNAASLHFNLPLTAALATLARRGGICPIIAWCHDLSWVNPLYTPHLHQGEPWSLLKTPLPGVTYVVVSEDRRGDLTRLFAESGAQSIPEISVVPAGVDVDRKLQLRPATRELAAQLSLLDHHPFMLLPVRITKRKNIELAIRVTRALRDLGMRPLLLVTGPPGPHNVRSVDYVDELIAERRAQDVEREVVLLFEQRRPSGGPWRASDGMMDDLYQLADLMLIPSAQEGFGIPLLEAGLVRLPIFCSDIPPFQEIGGPSVHTFGLDESPRSIASRIQRHLAEDSPGRLRRQVLCQYSWDSVFDRLIRPLLPRRPADDRD